MLDRDVDETLVDADAIYLPVSMIENLLVDPNVIWAALTTVHHKLSLSSPKDVEAALDDILLGMEGQKWTGERRRAKLAAM